jgi:aflatoxin B1 aldehyde reductase
MYNAVNRTIESELVPACRRYGLDIVVYNPIAGGLFSGKYSIDTIPTEGRYSDIDKAVGDMYRQRYFKDATFEALRLVEPIAKEHNLSLVEVAFRWLTNHSALNIKDGGSDGIIIGVSIVTQLTQNLQSIEKGPLPQAVQEALNKAWLLCKSTAATYVHGELMYDYNTTEALRYLN